MSERQGIWSLLASPRVYDAFHHLIGARRWLRRFARDTVRAPKKTRILDIGCGPASLLTYLSDVEYIGFDRNQAYIDQAKRNFKNRGIFICDDVKNFSNYSLEPVETVVAIGLLHHLTNSLVIEVLQSIVNTLKPGGRLVTADPCFHPDQSVIQRFVVSHDRGMHVRAFDEYVALCSTTFPSPAARFESAHIPFPYFACIMEAKREILYT